MENPPNPKKPKQVKKVPVPIQTDEEKAKILQQQKDLANLRFYTEQETKQKIKTKVADCNQLNRLLGDYLSSYFLCGFDVTGEPVIMKVAESEITRRALDDLFRDEMIKFQIKKSQEYGNFG